MPSPRSWLLCALLPLQALAGAVVQTGQVRAELVSFTQGLAPGQANWLGLKLEHIPHWHTYWKNAGDSGLPTTLTWKLPEGVRAGDIQWPTPKKLPIGPLLNFGYEGTVLLPVPLTVDTPLAGDSVRITLEADWLVCKVECIPQSGTFALDVPVAAPGIGHAAEFHAALGARPVDAHAVAARADVAGGALRFIASGLPDTVRGRKADVFPEVAGVVDNPAPVSQAWDGDSWQATWKLSDQRSASPERMPMVLAFEGGPALRVDFGVSGWSALESGGGATASAVVVDAPASSPTVAPSAAALGFAAALAFALLGGVILNLMPCVFPVLSLKVLALAQHGGDARERWKSALAYTAGVVLSFLALAGMLLAARAGGEQLGWGFQLQAPGTIVALASLFTLIGLNLAGAFEVGSLLPSSIASLRARDPTLDSFLTGVLAAAVASPCTAPFMGAALGAALTWPAARSLAVFAALGAGVALPYLLASAVPAVARLLPQPGRWMETFRHALAFPMFATVIWLVWVLGHQVGIDGATSLLLALLALALSAWWWSRRPEGGVARVVHTLALLAVAGGAFAWAAPTWRPAAPEARVGASSDSSWQPWSAAKVASLRGAGRPVFVDFTAAWCVTCQYNKRTTLADARVLEAFASRRVALLRADWTSRDAAIATELARLGRSGVPAYVFYDGARAPRLLSELPSVEEVRAAVLSTGIIDKE